MFNRLQHHRMHPSQNTHYTDHIYQEAAPRLLLHWLELAPLPSLRGRRGSRRKQRRANLDVSNTNRFPQLTIGLLS